jgi:hypothetical protein
MAMRTTTLIATLREWMRKELPTAPMETDYDFGHSLGMTYRYLGGRAFTYNAHERLAMLGLDSEFGAELGKGYRDGFFEHADRSTRDKYHSVEGRALKRLIRKQFYAMYPSSHERRLDLYPRVAVFSPIAPAYVSPVLDRPSPGVGSVDSLSADNFL